MSSLAARLRRFRRSSTCVPRPSPKSSPSGRSSGMPPLPGTSNATTLPLVATMLKAHAAEVATRATTTCTQVFGGMGFTWECDMHIWFKRAGYDRQVLGGPSQLRALAAALQFGD